MKKGWTFTPFEDVCVSMTKGPFGSDIKKSLYVPKSADTYKVYIQVNAIEKDASLGEYFISKEYFDSKMSRFEVKPNDYIITCDGTLGRYLRLPPTMERGIISASLLRITLKTNILPRFFEYLWDGYIMSRLTSDIRNSALVHLPSATKIGKVLIPLPSIAEQEHIVAELDLLQGIIDKQKAQLKELDTLAQSIFYDMFGDPVENEKGWRTIALKDAVLEMFLGPFGSALKTECYVNKEDSFCRVYEQKHAIRKTMNVETHYIDKEKFESLKRFEVHSGDFIMSCRGTIGEIYRLPEDAPIGIIHPSLMKIRIKEDVYSPTFFLWLLSRMIKNESTNGNCVQMAITAKELGTRTPIYPPLPLQQAFATKIEAIERQKASINASIAETQKLFDYTMDKYFG